MDVGHIATKADIEGPDRFSPMENLSRSSANGSIVGSIVFVRSKGEETVPVGEPFVCMNAQETLNSSMTALQCTDGLWVYSSVIDANFELICYFKKDMRNKNTTVIRDDLHRDIGVSCEYVQQSFDYTGGIDAKQRDREEVARENIHSAQDLSITARVR